jgi:hypothetical protein|tara:strand:+ start:469 stop:657 length:189 start_codon:yes stop_codon:yes gene_type:complete
MALSDKIRNVRNYGTSYGDWSEKDITDGSVGLRQHSSVLNEYDENTWKYPNPVKTTKTNNQK